MSESAVSYQAQLPGFKSSDASELDRSTYSDGCYVCDITISDRFLLLQKRGTDRRPIKICHGCYERHRHLWEHEYRIVSYRLYKARR